MPRNGDQKPCDVPGCAGTMTYRENSLAAPTRRTGTGVGDGTIVWHPSTDDGWQCDANPEHTQVENCPSRWSGELIADKPLDDVWCIGLHSHTRHEPTYRREHSLGQ